MATTELTASEIRSIITTLQRSLGSSAVVQVTFADGRSVQRQAATDEQKLTAIGYFEGLLTQVENAGVPRSRRLILSPTSGVEC